MFFLKISDVGKRDLISVICSKLDAIIRLFVFIIFKLDEISPSFVVIFF